MEEKTSKNEGESLKKKYVSLRVLIVLPVVLINSLSELIVHFKGGFIAQPNTFDNIFLCMVFNGSYSKLDSSLTTTFFGLSIPIVFNIIFGSYIYKSLQINNTYYFVRFKNRLNLYLQSVIKLIAYVALYCFIWMGFVFWLALQNSMTNITIENIKTVIICFLAVFLYTLLTTLLINALSFFTGTATSFIIVYIIIFLLYYISLKVSTVKVFNIRINISKFNIIDNTILSWKNELLFKDLIVSCIYIFIMLVILYIFVAHIDVGLKDKDNY